MRWRPLSKTSLSTRQALLVVEEAIIVVLVVAHTSSSSLVLAGWCGSPSCSCCPVCTFASVFGGLLFVFTNDFLCYWDATIYCIVQPLHKKMPRANKSEPKPKRRAVPTNLQRAVRGIPSEKYWRSENDQGVILRTQACWALNDLRSEDDGPKMTAAVRVRRPALLLCEFESVGSSNIFCAAVTVPSIEFSCSSKGLFGRVFRAWGCVFARSFESLSSVRELENRFSRSRWRESPSAFSSSCEIHQSHKSPSSTIEIPLNDSLCYHSNRALPSNLSTAFLQRQQIEILKTLSLKAALRSIKSFTSFTSLYGFITSFTTSELAFRSFFCFVHSEHSKSTPILLDRDAPSTQASNHGDLFDNGNCRSRHCGS